MKKIACVVLSIAIILTMSIASFANTEEAYQNTSSNKLEKEMYGSYNERVEKYDISLATAENMNTKELLECVVDYPLLINLFLRDNFQEGFDLVSKDFNGLKELLKRDDVANEVLKMYESLDVSMTPSTDDVVIQNICSKSGEELDNYLMEILSDAEIKASIEKDFKRIVSIDLLETLLAQKDIVQQMNNQELDRCKAAILSKQHKKSSSELFQGAEIDMINTIYQNHVQGYYEDLLKDVKKIIPYAAITVKTPKGSSVTVTSPTYWGDSKSATITAQFKNANILAKVIANADNRYNCHSYAWYKASTTTNHYWMNNPGKYMSDGSYTRVGSSPTATGQKIVWRKDAVPKMEYVHSGIVYSLNGSNPTVTSKMGLAPVIRNTVVLTTQIGGYEGANHCYKRAN